MKAILAETYGGPEVLEVADVLVPEVGPNGVLVQVHASSVNPVDWKLRKGLLSPIWKLRFPVIWGCDCSGVVSEVGSAVTLFKPGDEVYGFKHRMVAETYRGTYCEYAVFPENTLSQKPANLSHEEAAAVPLAAITAWQALSNQGKLKPGSRVLIHAGREEWESSPSRSPRRLGLWLQPQPVRAIWIFCATLALTWQLTIREKKFRRRFPAMTLSWTAWESRSGAVRSMCCDSAAGLSPWRFLSRISHPTGCVSTVRRCWASARG